MRDLIIRSWSKVFKFKTAEMKWYKQTCFKFRSSNLDRTTRTLYHNPNPNKNNLSLSHHSWIAPPMDQSLSSSSSSPIQFNLPPLSLSLFDGEPSSSEQQNEVFHGSTPSKHSSEPSSPTSSGYAAERGSASSTATSVSHVDEDSISHEIQEMNIHHPPPSVSNDSHDSCFPDERHLDEVYILPYSQFCFQHLVYCDWSRDDSVRCNLCHSV